MAEFRSGSRFRLGRQSEFRGKTVILPETINYSAIPILNTYTIPLRTEYRIDLISFANYSRTDLGWFIMGFNQITDISSLRRGTKINIPDPSSIL